MAISLLRRYALHDVTMVTVTSKIIRVANWIFYSEVHILKGTYCSNIKQQNEKVRK